MKAKLLPVLGALAVVGACIGLVAYNIRPNAVDTAAATGTPISPAPATTSVDGKALYKKSFDVIKAGAFTLKGEKLESWTKEWETKYDGQDLATLSAADLAITAMAESVGARYTVPQPSAAPLDSRAGIGITVELVGAVELLNALPKDATNSDIQKALVVSKEHPFKITGVISDSPASKALLVAAIKSGEGKKIVATMEELNKRGIRAGQTVVLAGNHNADQKLVDGLTRNEVIDLIKGEVDTVATIRVNDVDDDGEPIQLQFICTRARVRLKNVEAKPLSDGAWLLSVENLMSPTSREDLIAAAAKTKDAKALVVDLRNLVGLTPENVTTLVETFVEKPGITYQLLKRDGDGIASLVLGDGSYSVSIHKTKKPLELDISGHRKERAPAVVPSTTPIVFLTSSDNSVSARAAIEVVKSARSNVKLVGSPIDETKFMTTVPLDHGRILQYCEFEMLPGGVRSQDLKLDVSLTSADIGNNVKAIDAALTAVGIKTGEKR